MDEFVKRLDEIRARAAEIAQMDEINEEARAELRALRDERTELEAKIEDVLRGMWENLGRVAGEYPHLLGRPRRPGALDVALELAPWFCHGGHRQPAAGLPRRGYGDRSGLPRQGDLSLTHAAAH